MAAAMVVMAIGANAQSTDTTRTPESRAAALTERMETRLTLTDDQVTSVQSINLKYAEKNQEIWTGTSGRFAKFRALQSSQKDKDKELKAVLDKDQYKEYKAMREEQREKARAQYQARQQ